MTHNLRCRRPGFGAMGCCWCHWLYKAAGTASDWSKKQMRWLFHWDILGYNGIQCGKPTAINLPWPGIVNIPPNKSGDDLGMVPMTLGFHHSREARLRIFDPEIGMVSDTYANFESYQKWEPTSEIGTDQMNCESAFFSTYVILLVLQCFGSCFSIFLLKDVSLVHGPSLGYQDPGGTFSQLQVSYIPSSCGSTHVFFVI